jgi:hypothetical protein
LHSFTDSSTCCIVALLAVIVPSSLKNGPYVVQDTEGIYSVSRSQPWKLTVARLEGFLKLYLAGRFDWSKETCNARKELLKEIVDGSNLGRMKESIIGMEALVKNQNGQSFYVLESFRFSNQQRLIEAQVSRVVRVGATGVVTPLLIRLIYDESSISAQNPYGLKIKSIEEVEIKTTTQNEEKSL